jgi:hypothetical protein
MPPAYADARTRQMFEVDFNIRRYRARFSKGIRPDAKPAHSAVSQSLTGHTMADTAARFCLRHLAILHCCSHSGAFKVVAIRVVKSRYIHRLNLSQHRRNIHQRQIACRSDSAR